MDKPIYVFQAEVEGCTLEVLVNGFPVEIALARTPMQVAPPVNHALIGAGNDLTLRFDTVELFSGGQTEPKDVKMRGEIRAFEDGSFVGPGGGELIAESSFDLKLYEEQLEEEPTFPLEQTIQFDSDSHGFGPLLIDADAIDDETALQDYALSLRDLLARRDVGGLQREMAPKMTDFALAYYEDPAAGPGELGDFLQQRFFAAKALIDFERDDLVLSPWCEGRIWELAVAPGRALFTTEPDDKGSFLATRIFVGLVEGDLKVVR